MKKIMLLSCGSSACCHFAKVIKKNFRDDFYIIGTDINKEYLITSFGLIDKFYQVPYSVHPEYYKTIINICEKEKPDYLLPSFDFDQFLFYPENKDLVSLGVKSLSSSKENFEFYKDKKSMYQKLKLFNFPLPILYNFNELKEGEEYFVKPANGVGSNGARVAEKKDIKENEIIQEICMGPEITLECFHLNGKLSSAARERIEAKAGVCTKAKIYFDIELEKIAQKFISKINPPMFFNLQFMKNSRNESVITDINFRLAGGMGLTYVSGWDEISALANFMLQKDEKTIFSSFNLKSAYAIKRYEEYVTKNIEKTIAYDLDGTILNSFERHKVVMERALKTYNVTLDLSDYTEFKRSGKNNLQYLEYKKIPQDKAKFIQAFWIENIEKEEFLKFDFLYPDIECELENAAKSAKLILITARNNKINAKNQIKNLGIDKYFSHIEIVNSNTKTHKLKACVIKKHGVELIIGDTETDKKAAAIAGVNFEPRYQGFRNREFLDGI